MLLEKIPKNKRDGLCGCMPGEGCGCEVDSYNEALAEIRKVIEGL